MANIYHLSPLAIRARWQGIGEFIQGKDRTSALTPTVKRRSHVARPSRDIRITIREQLRKLQQQPQPHWQPTVELLARADLTSMNTRMQHLLCQPRPPAVGRCRCLPQQAYLVCRHYHDNQAILLTWVGL